MEELAGVLFQVDAANAGRRLALFVDAKRETAAFGQGRLVL